MAINFSAHVQNILPFCQSLPSPLQTEFTGPQSQFLFQPIQRCGCLIDYVTCLMIGWSNLPSLHFFSRLCSFLSHNMFLDDPTEDHKPSCGCCWSFGLPRTVEAGEVAPKTCDQPRKVKNDPNCVIFLPRYSRHCWWFTPLGPPHTLHPPLSSVYLIKRRHALPLPPPPPSHLLSCHSRLALLDQGAARESRRAHTYLPTYRSQSPQLVTSRHLSQLASGRPVGVGAGTLFGLADNGLAGEVTSPSCQLVIRVLAGSHTNVLSFSLFLSPCPPPLAAAPEVGVSESATTVFLSVFRRVPGIEQRSQHVEWKRSPWGYLLH